MRFPHSMVRDLYHNLCKTKWHWQGKTNSSRARISLFPRQTFSDLRAALFLRDEGKAIFEIGILFSLPLSCEKDRVFDQSSNRLLFVCCLFDVCVVV